MKRIMKRNSLFACVFCLFIVSAAWNASAETYSMSVESSHRSLRIVRHYEIAVKKGKLSVAALPALMSFWGATNWQIIKSSHFTYSAPPDKTEIISDNLGEPRRYYQFTWNAPNVEKITVEEKLEVELTCFNTLHTSAKLPYADDVMKRFAASLGADKDEGINPDQPELAPICDRIAENSRSAEDVVERVCDWINENIKFAKGQRTLDQTLAQKMGSCTPMSFIACSMLRHMGIPSERVDAKFIGGNSGHSIIEVFYPDAGWVFYDLSNWNRGFKSLDCLMTVGWGYRSGSPKPLKWTNGYFCVEKDTALYSDESEKLSQVIRNEPRGFKIAGVHVVTEQPFSSVKIRWRPLREIMLDTNIPPGPREYSDDKSDSTAATHP